MTLRVIFGTRQLRTPDPQAIYLLFDGAESEFPSKGRMGRASIQRFGKRVRLSPIEMRMLGVLLPSIIDGRLVEHEQLIEACYGDAEDGGSETIAKTIDVYILRLRIKLAPLGIGIMTIWGRGCTCVEVAPQEYKPRPQYKSNKESYPYHEVSSHAA